MKFLQKHKKIVIPTALLLAVLCVFLYMQRQSSLSRTISRSLEDLPRTKGAVTSEFYTQQLTVKELETYALLKERLDTLQGGVVALPSPLTGTEYLRVTAALQEAGNYFYGFVEVPMTADSVYVKYKESDMSKITDESISQVILFLSCAENINLFGVYGDDGTVTNLEKVQEAFSVNLPEKEAEIETLKKDTEEMLERIVAQLPDDAGEKSTVDFFLDWLSENMTLVTDAASQGETLENMGDVFQHIYAYNHTSAAVLGKGTVLGYARVLADLCCRAGMEAHVVMGTWKGSMLNPEGYALCAVSMNGQTVYIDACGGKSGVLAGERYMTAQGARNHMEFLTCFTY